ncbi:MAG: alkaline phosphatase family protein [Ignavibacteria bacterium]|nr:alkaline phosphatase family protein [Ignavibacteria bacterium]
MKILLVPCLMILAVTARLNGQTEEPRLIVLISIDQLPYSFLTRFEPFFGEGGFRRLLRHGAVFTEARFDYASTFTGPGHATIGSGTYPHQHGIVGNGWHDTATARNVYCVEDSSVQQIGGEGDGRSPRLLSVTTLSDELRTSSGFRSRVLSVAQKDRSAILLGGKHANAAYWVSDSLFVSSTYYMNRLPDWAAAFNASGVATGFFGAWWEKTLPPTAFVSMDMDDAPYEGNVHGLGRTFPHRITGNDTTSVTANYFSALWHSPFLNEWMMAFIRTALDQEQLGSGAATDMLCIGLSANDAVGHTFGPESHEIVEMTVHTDRLLADFFSFLDERIGLDRCIIALTSDHGIPPIPESILAQNDGRKAGRADRTVIGGLCEGYLDRTYSHPDVSLPWLARVVDGNIYLNRRSLERMGISPESATQTLSDSLRGSDLIAAVMTRDGNWSREDWITGKLRNSFNEERSGDILYALAPYFIDYAGPGTDHGQPYDYDTHVPVILMGAGVVPGSYDSKASPADLAPTIATILGIPFPEGRDGRVLKEALR